MGHRRWSEAGGVRDMRGADVRMVRVARWDRCGWVRGRVAGR